MQTALTVRELEVLRLVAQQMTDKEIARQLHISHYTVKNHVHWILDKTECRSRWEAVKKVLGISVKGSDLCDGCPRAARWRLAEDELRNVLETIKEANDEL